MRIGLISGSTRTKGNWSGLRAWVTALVAAHGQGAEVVTVDLAKLDLPLVLDPIMPGLVTDPSKYSYPQTREWSSLVRSLDAIVMVTPQYNWSIPAPLKNAIDHLYHEWKGKPALVVTYGGHGGGKAAVHLLEILGAMKLRVVDKAPGITLPSEYIRSDARVQGNEEWLQPYEADVVKGIQDVLALASE